MNIIQLLPHVNASLNVLATLLLLSGVWLIKQRRELAHKRVMMACFLVSGCFLVCYITYHYNLSGHHRSFPTYPPSGVRYLYLGILFTHILLAMSVPFLAIASIYLGLRDNRSAHRRVVRWAFPIWLYVSVTGVVVYVMLYQLYPPIEEQGRIACVNAAGREFGLG